MIPPHFRKLPLSQRQSLIKEVFQLTDEEISCLSLNENLLPLANILVESSIGIFPVPLGIASGFLIDRRAYLIPMATEEPSVIAAASFAARLCKAGGGISTWSDPPIMTVQVFLENFEPEALFRLETKHEEIGQKVNELIPSMAKRGGGFRGLDFEITADLLAVSIHIDVRDAMGANVINTVGEAMKPLFSEWTGGTAIMAILSNAADKRKAGASFEIPARFLQKGGASGEEVCKKIVRANEIARTFPSRAVTHNKGIMNGISALALATGNDTRSLEAGAHFFAQQLGIYQPLTNYSYEEGKLKGSIELPMTMGTIGGTVGVWPPTRIALKILNNPDASHLNRIGAALGLAQNLAALFALVTDGIQAGHMKLHNQKKEALKS